MMTYLPNHLQSVHLHPLSSLHPFQVFLLLTISQAATMNPLWSSSLHFYFSSTSLANVRISEPGSARNPVRLDSDHVSVPATSTRKPKPKPKPKTTAAPSTPRRENTSAVPKTPRIGKKAKEAAEKEQLLTYAKEWFKKLNREVFSMMLPENTDIIWNPKLISSAGRAHFKRYEESLSIRLWLFNVRCGAELEMRKAKPPTFARWTWLARSSIRKVGSFISAHVFTGLILLPRAYAEYSEPRTLSPCILGHRRKIG